MTDRHHNRRNTPESGQALVEYALILVLFVIAFGIAVAATGPVIGNVFSNTVYNLVGARPGDVDKLPDANEFWQTVTAVASQTPMETPLPTRTLPPPTASPTDGPSPTPTPVTPTRTPIPSSTPAPSPTAGDMAFGFPFNDSAREAEVIHWRLDNDYYMGGNDWFGSYFYGNRGLDDSQPNSPNRQTYNADISPNLYGKIDFYWGNSGPRGADSEDAFSISWRQIISLEDKTTLNFNIPYIDDGIRIWIIGGAYGGTVNLTTGGPDTCSNISMPWQTDGDYNYTGPGNDLTKFVRSGGNGAPAAEVGDDWRIFDDAYFGYNPESSPDSAIPSDCLIVDRWKHGAPDTRFGITRTVPAGDYMIQVDYYDNTGQAAIEVELGNANYNSNPDDARVDGAGTPVGGSPRCEWEPYVEVDNLGRANSRPSYWDEYPGDRPFPDGQRCFLELRGWINVPKDEAQAPKLTWWDIWDLQPGAYNYVEIAEYQGIDELNPDILDRDGITWTRFDLRNGDSYNYNWTHQSIDLWPLVSTYGEAGDSEVRVTMRFGIESRPGTAGTNRWYIDTMRLGKTEYKNFFPDKTWDFNDGDLETLQEDWIMSGHWNLTPENRRGYIGNAIHESVNTETSQFYEYRDDGSDTVADHRIHSMELKGWLYVIDADGVTVPTTDEEGDDGEPILTFWHAYNIGSRTGLEVQYTTDPYGDTDGVNWQALDGTAMEIIDWQTNASGAEQTSLAQVKIKLNNIRDVVYTDNGDVHAPFRLRFALTIPENAQPDQGWWIDDVRLEREGREGFIDYPFYDPADSQGNFNDWVTNGTWGLNRSGTDTARPDPANNGFQGFSYTDSAFGNFPANSNSFIMTRYPMDMYLDTPDNARSPDCTLSECTAPTASPRVYNATEPMMSFYMMRRFPEDGSGENIYVEWKRYAEEDTEWEILWSWRDGLAHNGTDKTAFTRQIAWERVEVDLTPMMQTLAAENDAGDPRDDDVVYRIRFTTNPSGGDAADDLDGLYIDDILIDDRPQVVDARSVWRLWPNGATVQVSSGTNTTRVAGDGTLQHQIISDVSAPIRSLQTINSLGNGLEYTDTIDSNPALYTWGWYPGGNWRPITYEQHSGLYAFHDSPAPLDDLRVPPAVGVAEPEFRIKHNAFSVLEMGTVIDLRGTEAAWKPTLEFWHRFAVGDDDDLRVFVREEDLSQGNYSRCNGLPQCYHHYYKWGDWEELTEVADDEDRTYTWQRVLVDLSSYAKSGTTAGRQIRIAFVHEALDDSDTWDGWYLDDIRVFLNDPTANPDLRVWKIANTADGVTFSDNARNMNNWIPEGDWGLSPEFFRGSGGGPTTLGDSVWDVNIWDVSSVDTAVSPWATVSDPDGFLAYSDDFLINQAASTTPFVNFSTPDIAVNWGAGGPSDGSTTLTDKFIVRAELVTGVAGTDLGTGTITFITASDDGVRFKYDALDNSDAIIDDGRLLEWNIIENWTYHARTIDMGTANLAPPSGPSSGKYKFVMEYFEFANDALLQLTIGNDTFAFTDSPKQGAGITFPDIPALQRSNSSLILDGFLDLTEANLPLMQFYEYYEIRGGSELRVEVSTDGGLTWTSAGLGGQNLQSTLDASWQGSWQVSYYEGRWLDYALDNIDNAANSNIASSSFNPEDSGYPFGLSPRKTEQLTGLSGSDLVFGTFPPIPEWNNNGPLDRNNDFFSTVAVRTLELTEPMVIEFRPSTDDGVRLWVNYYDGCTIDQGITNVAGPATYIEPGYYNRTNGRGGNDADDAYGDDMPGCLLVDDWEQQGSNSSPSVTRTFAPGTYIIQMDQYESEGGHGMRLEFDAWAPGYDDPVIYGSRSWMPTDTAGNEREWSRRQLDLRPYAGPSAPLLTVRFRLDRQGQRSADEHDDCPDDIDIYDDSYADKCRYQEENQQPFDWFEGWWLVDILITDEG